MTGSKAKQVYTAFMGAAFRAAVQDVLKRSGEWGAYVHAREGWKAKGVKTLQAGVVAASEFPVARAIYQRVLDRIYGQQVDFDRVVDHAKRGAGLDMAKQAVDKPVDDKPVALLEPTGRPVEEATRPRGRPKGSKNKRPEVPLGQAVAKAEIATAEAEFCQAAAELALQVGREVKIQPLVSDRVVGGNIEAILKAVAGKRCGLPKQIEWAHQHAWKIPFGGMIPAELLMEAPSEGAIAWLMFATSSVSANTTFYTAVVTKIVPSKSALDADAKVRDDSSRHVELIDSVYRCIPAGPAGPVPALGTNDPAAQNGQPQPS